MNNLIIKSLFYAVLALVGFLAAYSLVFNGSPDGFLRIIFPDPGADWYIAVGCSFLFFILCFIPFITNQDKSFRQVVEANADRIRSLRRAGSSDEDIARSIIDAAGIRPGYRYNMAKKKLIYYLAQFQ